MTAITEKTRREVKLKTGQIIPKGSEFSLVFGQDPNGSPYVTATANDGTHFKTRHFTTFFKEPTLEEMEEWVNDGIAETVNGDRTEPDGYGPDGAPSWLLALGII